MRESKIVLYLERKPLVFITCHIAYNKCNQMFWQPRGHSTKKKKTLTKHKKMYYR